MKDDYYIVPNDWKNPDWEAKDDGNEWKNYVRAPLRKAWLSLSDDQKMAIADSLNFIADSEDWRE